MEIFDCAGQRGLQKPALWSPLSLGISSVFDNAKFASLVGSQLTSSLILEWTLNDYLLELNKELHKWFGQTPVSLWSEALCCAQSPPVLTPGKPAMFIWTQSSANQYQSQKGLWEVCHSEYLHLGSATALQRSHAAMFRAISPNTLRQSVTCKSSLLLFGAWLTEQFPAVQTRITKNTIVRGDCNLNGAP